MIRLTQKVKYIPNGTKVLVKYGGWGANIATSVTGITVDKPEVDTSWPLYAGVPKEDAALFVKEVGGCTTFGLANGCEIEIVDSNLAIDSSTITENKQ